MRCDCCFVVMHLTLECGLYINRALSEYNIYFGIVIQVTLLCLKTRDQRCICCVCCSFIHSYPFNVWLIH